VSFPVRDTAFTPGEPVDVIIIKREPELPPKLCSACSTATADYHKIGNVTICSKCLSAAGDKHA